MHLKTFDIGVPGGWHDTCPHCGNQSVGITFQQLVSRVRVHYQNMKHPIVGSIELEVEERICSNLTPADQAAYCVTGAPQRKTVRWGEVQAFLNWLAKWVLGGGQLVPLEEAQRRADICAGCPYNIAVSGCGICRKAIVGFRSGIMKAQPVNNEDKLSACGICGCDLKSIVHVPLSTLQGRHDYSKVPWCWQHEAKDNSPTGA